MLEFSSEGISEPIRALLTDQFRLNLRNLKMYEVLDGSMTNQVEIFYPGERFTVNVKSRDALWSLEKCQCQLHNSRSIIEEKDGILLREDFYSIDMQRRFRGFQWKISLPWIA